LNELEMDLNNSNQDDRLYGKIDGGEMEDIRLDPYASPRPSRQRLQDDWQCQIHKEDMEGSRGAPATTDDNISDAHDTRLPPRRSERNASRPEKYMSVHSFILPNYSTRASSTTLVASSGRASY
jgi:hypothetical protein